MFNRTTLEGDNITVKTLEYNITNIEKREYKEFLKSKIKEIDDEIYKLENKRQDILNLIKSQIIGCKGPHERNKVYMFCYHCCYRDDINACLSWSSENRAIPIKNIHDV